MSCPPWESDLWREVPTTGWCLADDVHKRRRQKSFLAYQFALLVNQALAGGAKRLGPNTYEWDVSRGCGNPYRLVCHSTGIGSVEMLCACRSHCDVCLKHKRQMWAARALAETKQAARTWLGTLTLRSEEQYRAACEAAKRAGQAMPRTATFRPGVVGRSGWTEYDRDRHISATCADLEQTPGVAFERRVGVIGEEVTRWLKRVRKRCCEEWQAQGLELSGGEIRYFLVVERHVSGEPHWHVLLHETSELKPIRNDWLCKPPRDKPAPQTDARWHLGFSNFKLIGLERATYPTKYLTKSLLARVRASLRYGVEDPPKGIAEGVKLDPQKGLDFIGDCSHGC